MVWWWRLAQLKLPPINHTTTVAQVRRRIQTTYGMTTAGGGSSDSGTGAADDVGSGPEVGSSADPGGEPIELDLEHTFGRVRSVV